MINLPSFTFDELYNLQTRFLDNFIYPANLAQAASINSTLIADNCLGRVDITRTFEGVELNTEYIFGLFATRFAQAQSLSILGVPISYEVVHFTANEYITAASTIVMFNLSAIGIVAPVEMDTWIAWNAAGQIAEYDATFRWFDYLIDSLIEALMHAINATTPAAAVEYLTQAVASDICTMHERYCNYGANQQYQSFNACYTFLIQEVRFGAAYELGRNTLMCRTLHENMIPFRPEVHCPHVGPSGGGMCVDDMTYAQRVQQPYFVNMPFIPYGYQNSNKTVAAMR